MGKAEDTEGEKIENSNEKPEGDEESSSKKEDVDNLRKVIKVDNSNEEKTTGEKKKEDIKKEETSELDNTTEDDTSGDTSRQTLEQKRAILQSIKDFDFQIKKNQEDIDGIHQKLDNLSKDLDDLVSLYEIVSEQMNPFVGLSKVTKKRLDALETFTKEIDLLKERTGELESFAIKSGAKLKYLGEGEIHADTINTEGILGDESEEMAMENWGGKSTGQLTPITVTTNGFSDTDLDMIIENALASLTIDGKIDSLIDEFIENLKG